MKMIMKEQTNKANNLRLGAIYMNANTSTPCRLVNIITCTGAWLETYDGQGYAETVKFEDVHYADTDEVQDFLGDHAVFMDSDKAPSHKEECSFSANIVETIPSWMNRDGDSLNISDKD